MQMARKSLVLFLSGLLLFVAIPRATVAASTAFQQEEEPAPDIRDRIADFIEQFVTDEASEDEAALADEEASAIEIDPNIISGAIAIVAVGIAALLIVRGYQAPGKRDPFRSRW